MHQFIRHLRSDHDKQRRLGTALKEAKTAEDREKLRKEMYEGLVPHMEGEEHSIFTYMRGSKDVHAKDGALEAIQEHHVGKMVMQEILDLTLDSEVFKAKASVLDELNRHHMEEEEKEHFPWLERNASERKLDELFKSYEEAEKAKKS